MNIRNYSGRSSMLENSHNASPFPLEGGRLGWGWEGGNIDTASFISPFCPHPSLPQQAGEGEKQMHLSSYEYSHTQLVMCE